MAQAFFKQFWIFKSLQNFSIFALFSSGTGYFGIRYLNDKKFEHPVFRESLRVLEQNSQVVDLIGFPIYIDTGLKARATITDKIVNSSFPVKGPRGYLNVELAGESKPQGAIQNSLTRAESGELTEEARKARKDELQEFYIPDPALITEIDKVRADDATKLDKVEIPKESLFWKIHYLYVDVSKDFRIVLLPKKESDEKDAKETRIVDSFKPNPGKKNLREVLDEEMQRAGRKRSLESGATTEEEIEELRKFRMQQTYQKIGYMRFYMFIILVGGAMSFYIIMQKYKRKNMMGSVLHNQALMYIKRNDMVMKELGKTLKFPQQIRGAAIDDDADFELDAMGEKRTGTFRVQGKFDKKKNEWEMKTIEMILKDRKGEEQSRKKIY